MRSYLTDVLRNLGYDVIASSDAHSANVLLVQMDRNIDSMLTDIVMPGKNEKQLGDEALRLRPNLKKYLHDRVFEECRGASGTARSWR